MSQDQLPFDVESMIHEAAVAAAPEWAGAPLHLITTYYPPAELDAAFEYWQFLHAHDKTHISRMWHRSITVPRATRPPDTGSFLTRPTCVASCGRTPDKRGTCLGVGDLMYQPICEQCEWNGITDRENDAVGMWHDHALPGWRELPIVPSRLRMMDKDGLSTPRGSGSPSTTQSRAGSGGSDHHRAPPLRHAACPGPLTVGWLRPVPNRSRP